MFIVKTWVLELSTGNFKKSRDSLVEKALKLGHLSANSIFDGWYFC